MNHNHAMLSVLCIVLGSAAGYGSGCRHEEAAIKATCDDADAHTMLGGHEYVCMTVEKATTDLKEVFRQGVEAGRALSRKETAL